MKKKLSSNKFIPVNKPFITHRNALDVFRVVKSGWISSDGPQVKKFEEQVAKKIGVNYGISVSNGTAALEIALKALDLKKNSEVIIPNFTIISTILAVKRNNLKPVLVDCDLHDWNMNYEQIKKKITKKTKCIIATHIYGFPCEIEKIKNLAKNKNIYIIEDAAEMLGHQNYKKKFYGSFGDMSTLSFYANKHITTGEGGMILTKSKKLYLKCKSFRNLCFGEGEKRFIHKDFGWNYRLSNIQAALGISQLKDIESIILKKKNVGRLYYNLLKDEKKIYIQPPYLDRRENIYWVVGIINNSKIKNSLLVKKLLEKGIQTRPFFGPMSMQPIIKHTNTKYQDLKNSEKIFKLGFYLPSSIGLSFKEIKRISNTLKNILKKC
ncbi:DegT/DnrJ/EryC1/StrS family aminotransferase [Pelagibacteraceae bacterium]|nr:DegT/DnrJ/EryC1/StrS family aminotransferase [Pelagibacteraceae bacterium]